jgi:ABC-type multidrug transport system ATPase subunit
VAVTGGGSLGRVPLAVITLAALAAFEAVSPLPAAAIQLGQSGGAARRVTAVLDAPDPVTEPAVPAAAAGLRPGTPVSVRLRGVAVAYRPGGPRALDGIDLDLAPGRRVALLGPAGAGKSTVAAVLLRFVDVSAGKATFNEIDLRSLRGDDVRSVVGGLIQDAHIFDSTIRANLLIGAPGATDAELAAAAKSVRLLDWITSLPAGLGTPVGARGTMLSGGQRQRLALARALLADPAVLILDEPTAHLDPDTRAGLAADLLAVAADARRSTLLITHDLSGLDRVDEIVVLRDGRVAERGTDAELRAAGGLYGRMLRAGGLAADPPARARQKLRWSRSATAPTAISRTTLSRSWATAPPAADQLVKASESPRSAAAGMVVTEMNTPISAPARASVRDTTPTSPARTATITENRSGLLIRSETGRTPSEYARGTCPAPRMTRPNSKVTTIATPKPAPRAIRPRTTAARSRRSRPSAVAMMALYSGPTTMAPTIRIVELVRIPTAPIRPARTSRA